LESSKLKVKVFVGESLHEDVAEVFLVLGKVVDDVSEKSGEDLETGINSGDMFFAIDGVFVVH